MESKTDSEVPKPILAALADFIHNMKIEDLPSSVVKRVDMVLMDLICSTWSVLGEEGSRALWHYARAMNDKSEASLWGTNYKVGVSEAATVNGALGYEAEFDDGNTLGGHWGSSSIPTILSLAERNKSSASEVILAIVAAYETGNRISRVVSRGLLERGIHFPGCMGAFAAIAGAGRILKLNTTELAGALGHAALVPVAPYLPGHVGADTKNLYSGWPNHCGIHFTAMAKAGYIGSSELLEGRDGLARALGWQGDTEELRSTVLTGLGKEWAISKTYFKAYPCCRWLHAPIKGVLDIVNQYKVKAVDIDEIRVLGPAFLEMYAIGERCTRPIQAKYNLAYCLSAAAVRGVLGQTEFVQKALEDCDIFQLSQRVRFNVDDRLEAEFPNQYSTIVLVKMLDGRQLRSQNVPPWGPDDPPDLYTLEQKFLSIMSRACTNAVLEDWLKLFRNGLRSDIELTQFFRLLDHSSVN